MDRKFSGRSTPISGTGRSSPSKVVMGADEQLARLLAQRPPSCASPGAMSQGSQKVLPDGEPMEVEESERRLNLDIPNFLRLSPPPPMPAWASMSAIGLNQQHANLSPTATQPGEGISPGASAAKALGEGIAPSPTL